MNLARALWVTNREHSLLTGTRAQGARALHSCSSCKQKRSAG